MDGEYQRRCHQSYLAASPIHFTGQDREAVDGTQLQQGIWGYLSKRYSVAVFPMARRLQESRKPAEGGQTEASRHDAI
jgi:hypothetical protein